VSRVKSVEDSVATSPYLPGRLTDQSSEEGAGGPTPSPLRVRYFMQLTPKSHCPRTWNE
jgi:hypothetical protein